MSLSESPAGRPECRRTIGFMVLALLGSLSLGGCFQPLYGGATGSDLRAALASIEVDPIPDRIGHYLRNELAFDLDGSGASAVKRYRLTIKLNERIQAPVVDTLAGRAQSGTVTVEANYLLTAMGDPKVIAQGAAVAFASYDRTQQRFASSRAAREAEIRVANDLAQQIRTRVAAALIAGR
jgi:LPS-assembly lipoprotein